MVIAAILLLVALGGLVLLYAIACLSYVRAAMRDVSVGTGERAVFPRVAVILSVRGDAEAIEDCLDRLAALDYPDFELHVVVDSPEDPHFSRVGRWIELNGHVRCHRSVLTQRSPFAALKCSAVRQAIHQLDSGHGLAVIVDKDTKVYRSWLRDMACSMRDPDVGVASGNRWYLPGSQGWGSVVRFVYNAFAIPPMYLGKMAWGGSLAIHREVFSHPQCERVLWSACTEDAAVPKLVQLVGRRCFINPAIMLLNTDSTDLGSCIEFIIRQLVWTRLYHPQWPIVLGGIVVSYSLLLVQSLGAGVSLAMGDIKAALIFGVGPVVALLSSLVLIMVLHFSVRRVLRQSAGITLPAMNCGEVVRIACALPVALIAITIAAVVAAKTRSIRWSGIEYLIEPPDRVRMVSDDPWRGC